MKIETKIQKWGNGLALRIAGIMREIPNFKEGTPVEVEISEEALIIKKLKPNKRSTLKYTEVELLAGMTENNAQADLLTKPFDSEF